MWLHAAADWWPCTAVYRIQVRVQGQKQFNCIGFMDSLTGQLPEFERIHARTLRHRKQQRWAEIEVEKGGGDDNDCGESLISIRAASWPMIDGLRHCIEQLNGVRLYRIAREGEGGGSMTLLKTSSPTQQAVAAILTELDCLSVWIQELKKERNGGSSNGADGYAKAIIKAQEAALTSIQNTDAQYIIAVATVTDV